MFRTTILVLFGLAVAPCFPALAKQEQPPASQKQVALITGLDGATYEAYLPEVVERWDASSGRTRMAASSAAP